MVSESGDSQSDAESSAGSSAISGPEAQQQVDLNSSSKTQDDNMDMLDDRKSLQDTVFASMYMLSKNRNVTDIRWTTARIVLDFLQVVEGKLQNMRVTRAAGMSFISCRDPGYGCYTDRTLKTVLMQAIDWILFRQVVAPMGYETYIAVFYALSAVILLALVLTVWAAAELKKNEATSTWMQ
eukprot:gene6376-6608_t